jgi:hypothetical protein
MKKNNSNPKTKARNKFLIETLAVFCIIISPFIFKLHQYLSVDPEATINFLGFVIDRNGFADLNTYGWFLLGKLVPFYLLAIWFFTCKHWWYHIILIPTIMYAFQIFEVIYSEDNIVDTENIWWLLPVCMVIIPFVYLIRIKLYDKHVHGIDLEAMEAELHSLKQKQVATKNTVQTQKAILTNPVEKAPPTVEYRTLSEWLNQELSTANLLRQFNRFQSAVKNWLL